MNNTLELTIPASDKAAALVAPVDTSQLDTAKPLGEIFQPFQTVLDKWEAKVAALTVTDISQKTEMEQARLARLELKKARVEMEHKRKSLVEGLNKRTEAINGTVRIIRTKIEGLEESLRASEEFAERHAVKVKAELKAAREKELAPFLDTPLIGDLSDLSKDDYAKTLENAKLLRQAKIDAAAKAEADRKAKEEADRAERERVAAENAKLKADAIEAARVAEIERKRLAEDRAEEQRKAEVERKRIEAERVEERRKSEAEAKRLADAARKEREEIEAAAKAEADKAAKEAAKLRAELAAKARVEAERKAKAEAEAKAAQEAARKAAAAPDKSKLNAFADAVRALPVPELSNPFVTTKLSVEIERLAAWVESAAESL